MCLRKHWCLLFTLLATASSGSASAQGIDRDFNRTLDIRDIQFLLQTILHSAPAIHDVVPQVGREGDVLRVTGPGLDRPSAVLVAGQRAVLRAGAPPGWLEFVMPPTPGARGATRKVVIEQGRTRSSPHEITVASPRAATVAPLSNGADLNGDGALNILDVQLLANAVNGVGPGIRRVTPQAAYPGSVVRIEGFGFSTDAAQNDVAFGTVQVRPDQRCREDLLTVRVPALPGVTSVPVTVTNPAGFVSNVVKLEIRPAPPLTPPSAGASQIITSHGVNAAAQGAVVADFNVDGVDDVALALFPPGGGNALVEIWHGQSSGGLPAGRFHGPPVVLDVGAGVDRVLPSTGDVDRDGSPDIVLAIGGANGPALVVALNDGNGRFPSLQSAPIGAAQHVRPFCVTVGHLDTDDQPDVAVGLLGAGPLAVAFLQANGAVAGPPTLVAHPSSGAPGAHTMRQCVAAFDADDDGDQDVVLLSGGAPLVFENSGARVFAASGVVPNPTGANGWQMGAADWNGDGDTDILVAAEPDWPNRKRALLWSSGRPGLDFGALQAITSLALAPNAADVPDLHAHDFDHDGAVDILTCESASRVLPRAPTTDWCRLVLGDGQGGVRRTDAIGIIGSWDTWGFLPMDADGDLVPDFLRFSRQHNISWIVSFD